MDVIFLKPAAGSKKSKKRVGRGKGSGHGKTCGRGHKGQGARAGGGPRPGFEGGQMPLQRRVPKRGFKNPFKKRFALVNVGQLEVFEPGSEISPEILHSQGIVRSKTDRVKLLGNGILSKALTVKVHGFSSTAREKIETSGGRVESI
jgi:large subunit ribosomal protein L15